MSVLAAAIALAQCNYAVHWVRPRSKAPIGQAWTSAPVDELSIGAFRSPEAPLPQALSR